MPATMPSQVPSGTEANDGRIDLLLDAPMVDVTTDTGTPESLTPPPASVEPPRFETVEKLYVEADMPSADATPLGTGQAVTLCRRCPGKSEPNDDSAAVIQTSWGAIVLVVADGVGGSPHGHRASAIAVQTVAQKVLAAAPNADLRACVLDGIEQANQSILKLSIGAATTLAVVEVQERVARGYQVGDSTMLIVGQRGALKWKSTSHSPVGYAIEAGMLDESDAMLHDERHVVSNLVGSREMHIEIGPAQPLAIRDTIIVGSDGLFDNARIEEVIQRGRCGKLSKRIKQLDDLATERMMQNQPNQPGKPDDLSVILYTPK
ncbi:MAG: protein phosphatase 2C domain-containing protein [Planctomycetota bacterium]